MFKQKLFNSNIEPSCGYCLHGTRTQDKEAILCQKKGIVTEDFRCRKFIYDPISRQPKVQPKMIKYDKSDFEL